MEKGKVPYGAPVSQGKCTKLDSTEYGQANAVRRGFSTRQYYKYLSVVALRSTVPYRTVPYLVSEKGTLVKVLCTPYSLSPWLFIIFGGLP